MHIRKPTGAIFGVDLVGELSLVDSDVHMKCFREGHKLHVITVSASLGHAVQVALKHCINLGGRCWSGVWFGGV